MALFVSGLSHKNAPVELRERLAVEEDKLRELLRDVAATGLVQEALILTTCNRVEVYGIAEAPGEARAVAFR
ncbi:MAG: glutamyl-tRNA reductase, partial [Candidatus Rokubacteria bacterium]|nr:glutamyl-tRNA reductase [Candidatus Rokubacteria bacterium]